MSRVADGNHYEDVFVFEDLVYAMQRRRLVMRVYRNRSNSLIKLHDVRYPCKCSHSVYRHSITVTKDHIIQCCSRTDKLVFILDRSGDLLRKISTTGISGHWPILCQVDVEGNFLIADRWTNHLVIANANQPSSQWDIVDLANLPGRAGCRGAVWFRHRLYVATADHMLIFTPVD